MLGKCPAKVGHRHLTDGFSGLGKPSEGRRKSVYAPTMVARSWFCDEWSGAVVRLLISSFDRWSYPVGCNSTSHLGRPLLQILLFLELTIPNTQSRGSQLFTFHFNVSKIKRLGEDEHISSSLFKGSVLPTASSSKWQRRIHENYIPICTDFYTSSAMIVFTGIQLIPCFADWDPSSLFGFASMSSIIPIRHCQEILTGVACDKSQK